MTMSAQREHTLIIRALQILLVIITILAIAPLLAAKGGRLTPAVSSDTLSALEIADLQFMREEEKLARDVYLAQDALWSMMVLENIALSEQRHMDAMKTLLDNYRVADPVRDEASIGEFVNAELVALYPSLIARAAQSRFSALMVGALIEEVDMEDIQHAIDATRHDDIKAVYERLLCGSRNHLRAFVGQIEASGEPYVSQLYPDDSAWVAFIESVIDSPIERDCGITRH